jgi:hypothetical protein
MGAHVLSELLRAGRDADRIDPVEFARTFLSGELCLVRLLGGVGCQLDSSLNAKAQVFVSDAISLLAEALKLNPDAPTVLRWFNDERLPLLSYMTPAEAIASGNLDALLKYVESLESGWSG